MTDERINTADEMQTAEKVPSEAKGSASQNGAEETKTYTEETAKQAIEAMLFAAGHPLAFDSLAEVLGIEEETVRLYARQMQTRYTDRGIQLIMLGDACQLATREEYIGEIRRVLGIRRGGNLSRASLETLAIIAYHQPVTRSYVDEVRGVDTGYVVSSLAERGLIESKGRLEAPGRPTLYGTTDMFLRVFGLNSIEELPPAEMFLKEDADGVNPDAAAELLAKEE